MLRPHNPSGNSIFGLLREIAIGAKRAETRNWVRAELAGRRLAIHASIRWSPAQAAFAVNTPAVSAALRAAGLSPTLNPKDPGLPLGSVVGTALVRGFAEYAELNPEDWRRVAAAAMGDHDHGRFAWLLGDPLRFTSPVAASGKRGLWFWEPPAGHPSVAGLQA